MKDERYDVSADMRLLELQRKAIGASAHVLQATRYTDTDPFTAELADDDESTAASGTILVAQLDAQPRKGLIAGALITVSLSINNDGDELGRRIWASLPLPSDMMYRHGTLLIDGVSANEDRASDFFSNGVDLGDILPRARRTLSVKLLLDAGVRDVILTPHVGAASGAVLGLLAVRLMRSAKSHLSVVGERPFYEFDERENALESQLSSAAQRGVDGREQPPVGARPPTAMANAADTAPPLDGRAESAPAKQVVPTVRGAGGTKAPRKSYAEPDAQPRPERAPSQVTEHNGSSADETGRGNASQSGKRIADAPKREQTSTKPRKHEAAKRREHDTAERYNEAARTREQEAAALREQEAAALREQEAAALREQEAAALREQEAAALREQEAAALREQEAAALREQEAAALREQEAAALREQEAAALREQEATARREQEAAAAAVLLTAAKEAAKRAQEPVTGRPASANPAEFKASKRPAKSAPTEPAKRPPSSGKTRAKDARASAATIAAKAQTIAESLHVPAVAEPITIMISDTVAKAKTAVKIKPKVKTIDSVSEVVVGSAPAQPDLADVVAGDLLLEGKGGPVLVVRIDRKRLAALVRLFSGTSLGMVAHYLVLNALATTQAQPGDGEDSAIATFVAQQEQLLSRALISTRLGKTPDPDSVAATLPTFPPQVARHSDRVRIAASGLGQAVLARAFAPTEIDFLERMLTNGKAPQFLRAAQLFVALCANTAVATSNNDQRPANAALAAYAALAATEISRIFLRAKLTGAPDLFIATEPAFDDAARKVLDELGKLIA